MIWRKFFQIWTLKLLKKILNAAVCLFYRAGIWSGLRRLKLEIWNLCILTDCASCESTLKGYFKNTGDKPRFINAGEFVASQNVRFSFKKNLKVTFHKPCHLESADFIKPLLEKCENIEYIEMKDFEECCGFAGEFALKSKTFCRNFKKESSKYS